MPRMLRISFLVFIAALAPLVASAQQPSAKVPRIGWLANHPPTTFKPYEGFREGLREMGYVEGQNVVIELMSAQGQLDRLPELAKELVRRNVDVLMTGGEQGLMAAKQATNTIPIVGIVCDMREKVIEKLARPGGKATGLTCIASDLSSKRLELMKEVVPNLSRVAVLYNPGEPEKVVESQQMQEAAPRFNLNLSLHQVLSPAEIEAAFEAMRRDGTQGLVILSDVFMNVHRQVLADLALRNRIPAMYGFREFTEVGGLISYGASLHALHKDAARYVDKILKGASPGEIPVEQPRRFELVINMKTAQALGLSIPEAVLLRTDEIME